MEAYVQARNNFVQKVMAGEYSCEQAEAELDRMEREFGELAFLPGTVNRKPRPWTMDHLRELKRSAACGAGSRAFLSYMAEVGEEVHRKPGFREKIRRFRERVRRFWKRVRQLWRKAWPIAVVLAAVVLVWLWSRRK